MKLDIILAGVGGQGILSISAAIGVAALKENLNIKQAETHGMSQRGGAVVSHLRIADYPIASDLIPFGTADLIIAVEPMEALRYLPYLSKKGCVVSNEVEFKNISNYPATDKIIKELKKMPYYVILNADQIAKDIGNAKASNMVMLGAAAPYINISSKNIEESITNIFNNKGDNIVKLNINAFRSGKKFTENYLK